MEATQNKEQKAMAQKWQVAPKYYGMETWTWTSPNGSKFHIVKTGESHFSGERYNSSYGWVGEASGQTLKACQDAITKRWGL